MSGRVNKGLEEWKIEEFVEKNFVQYTCNVIRAMIIAKLNHPSIIKLSKVVVLLREETPWKI